MIECTGLGLTISNDRNPEVINWPFIVQGKNKGIFERIDGLEYSSVIRVMDNYSGTAYIREEDIAIWMVGVIHNKEALWNTLLDGKQYSNCDVDLLIHLVKLYGPTAFRLVNGRFAAIIKYQSNLYLVTDHAGTIPLYFNISENSIHISTEAKSLTLGTNVSKGLRPFSDTIHISDTINTVFQDINRVPVGTIVNIDLEKFQFETKNYWQMPSERLVLSEKKASQLLYDSLKNAVELRKNKNGQVGVILSGGIDSSAITSLIAQTTENVHTFSIGTEKINEFEYAKLVANKCQTNHHEFIIKEEDFLEKIPHVVFAAEVPQSEYIEYLLPVYITYEKVSSITNHILTGYGSDVLFGGMYDPNVSIHDLDELIYRDVLSTDGSNEFTHAIGLVHGIWTEHPFWDREFLRIALQLDPRLKNLHGIEKYILRKSFESVLPHRNVWRKKIGVHQSTGTESAFTKWINENSSSEEPIKLRKDKFIYRLLKALYEENAKPDDININDMLKQNLKVF